MPKTGGCQCGAIRFSVKIKPGNTHVCHCRMCQKAVGNFFAPYVGAESSDITWTRGAPTHFQSSERVSRGFCEKCGTPLTFEIENVDLMSLTIGSFDDPGSIQLDFELGMESRQPQLDQLGHIKHYGASEDNIKDKGEAIRNSNRQHPDHEMDSWSL